jgi:DNA repair protein RecN (Recombination protein N)
MLRTLTIRDFVIVDLIELEFSSGFTVFTGETGAGKSILIDALQLALGGRGDASMVREGAAKADVTADFALTAAAASWLAQHELASEEGGALLRRVIDNAGRSKAYINGIAATAAQLRELGELLVDIHGQHAHQSLLKLDAQRALLDNQVAVRNPEARSEVQAVASAFKAWRALARQREEYETNAKNVLLERERLEWQVGELDKLAAKPGEWADITNEHSRLSHAASLLEGAQEALAVISESDHPILSQLSSLNQKLSKLVDVDAGLQAVLDCTEPARIQLQEAVYALNNYLDKVELDPGRLQQVDARMEALHGTARKFRVAPEELPDEHAALAAKLQQLADATDLDGLRLQEEKARAAYMEAAGQLSRTRAAAADLLGSQVTSAMQELSMSGGSFVVALNDCEPGAHGLEQVEFLVAGHAGVAPRPLAKVASGGELAHFAGHLGHYLQRDHRADPDLRRGRHRHWRRGGRGGGTPAQAAGAEPPGAVRDPPAAGGQPGQPAPAGGQGHDRCRQDSLAHRRARQQGTGRGSGAHAGRDRDHRNHAQARARVAGVVAGTIGSVHIVVPAQAGTPVRLRATGICF